MTALRRQLPRRVPAHSAAPAAAAPQRAGPHRQRRLARPAPDRLRRPHDDRGYSGGRAYGQSKLAQIMSTFELAERVPRGGSDRQQPAPGTYMPTKIVLEEIGRRWTASRRYRRDRASAVTPLEGVSGGSSTGAETPPPTRRPTTPRRATPWGAEPAPHGRALAAQASSRPARRSPGRAPRRGSPGRLRPRVEHELDRGLAHVESMPRAGARHPPRCRHGRRPCAAGRERARPVRDHRREHHPPARRGLSQADAFSEQRRVHVAARQHGTRPAVLGRLDLSVQQRGHPRRRRPPPRASSARAAAPSPLPPRRP